jgi:hypothetical protein
MTSAAAVELRFRCARCGGGLAVAVAVNGEGGGMMEFGDGILLTCWNLFDGVEVSIVAVVGDGVRRGEADKQNVLALLLEEDLRVGVDSVVVAVVVALDVVFGGGERFKWRFFKFLDRVCASTCT